MKKDRVNIVGLSKEINYVLSDQKEVLQVCKGGNYRPFLILLRLKFHAKGYMFALPRRKTTEKNRKHGLHYTKMIPVHSKYLIKYYMSESVYDRYIILYIERQLELIIKEAQLYLDKYELGERYKYSVDIDAIIGKLHL